MALKFSVSRTAGYGGGGGGTYDHNLLVNRGLPDQHTIESVTGLRTLLDKKYEKPFSGIPKNDLGFGVATLGDLDALRKTTIADLQNQITAISLEVQNARGTETNLRKYIDTKVSFADWSGGGGTSGGHVNSEVGYPIYESYEAYEGQTIFLVSKEYRMGTHQLEVYWNGILMEQDDDYEETNETTITFLYGLEQGDVVRFQVRAVINSGIHEEYQATEGQTNFTLFSPYGINQNILQVYRNGSLLRKGRDYRETDSRTVDFVYPLVGQDYITFIQPGATDPLARSSMDTEISRLKTNLGYTTMILHDSVNTTETDYVDMYVDTFITDMNLHQVGNFDYDYVNRSLLVKDIHKSLTSREDFMLGTVANTDIYTIPGVIMLQNLGGAASQHDFEPYSVYTAEHTVDAFIIRNRYRDLFKIFSKDGYLFATITNHDQPSFTVTLASNGLFVHTTGRQDSLGNIHLVYTHETEVPTVHYTILQADGTFTTMVVSDPAYEATTPDLGLDTFDGAHIVFASKRIDAAYLNVDYVTVDAQGVRSGIKDITFYHGYDGMNPRIAVGKDNRIRIVYETLEYDGLTKNIKYAVVVNGLKEQELFLTTSTTFDNSVPAIDIDNSNIARLVWISKRLGAAAGIDYCSITAGGVLSGVRMVVSGMDCSDLTIAADSEGNSHIIFAANHILNDTLNLVYAIVQSNDTVQQFEDVQSMVGVQMTQPKLRIYGNTINLSFLGDDTACSSTKSLSNYTGSGGYDLVFDSDTPDTKWLSLETSAVVPAEVTSLTVEYRVSNDNVIWSAWKDSSLLTAETLRGRYLHIRASLLSSNSDYTPEINAFTVSYRPTFIEVQSVPKASEKDVDAIVAIGRFTGDVTFQVSRDGGNTFKDAPLNTAVDMTSSPQGRNVVIKANIPDGAKLDAWASLW